MSVDNVVIEPDLMPSPEPIVEDEEFYSQPEISMLPPLRARAEIIFNEGVHGDIKGFVLFEKDGEETKITGVISGLRDDYYKL